MKIPKIFSIFIGLFSTLVSLGPAYAAVFDCPAGDVNCLIDSINTANINGEADNIYLAAGSYIIAEVNNFDDGPTGLPLITSKITIIGKGASMTFLNRDLNAPSFRIFNVISSGELDLRQLTITGGNGDSGGGILNNGTLSLTGCIVMDNNAWSNGASLYYSCGGGILNVGTLSLLDCIVMENHAGESGAGIYNANGAKLEIQNSVLKNNIADGPGGGIRIRPDGMVTIEKSSIIDNAAGFGFFSAGGGIDFDAGNLKIASSVISGNTSSAGGGGMTLGGETTIENCTIAFNASSEDDGGGIHSGWGGSIYIVNSTISGNVAKGNGGGIKFGNPGLLELQNTIISGNTATTGMDWQCTSGDLGKSLGYNLIGDPSGCDVTLQSTDLIGHAGLDVFTEDATPGKGHFPLLSNSQAIDSGDDAACQPTDQLGNPRVDGDGDTVIVCDIGAIEFLPPYIEVQIDIKPGSYPNSINLKSKGKVPVAILTTDDFDAYDVDPETCYFAGASPLRWNMHDLGKDGDDDMVLHFNTQDLVEYLNKDSTEASLECETYAGIQITGTDSVNIVPKGKGHYKNAKRVKKVKMKYKKGK
jgi:hypothetical protein